MTAPTDPTSRASDPLLFAREIRAVLAAHADPERAVGQQRYMKSAMPFHGLATPLRRAVVRPVLDAHPMGNREAWEDAIRLLWDDATHREERYAAIELLRLRRYAPWRDLDVVPLVRHLVTTGAWWDLVDSTAPVLGEVLRAHPEFAETLREWAVDEDLWVRRAAIIAQLDSKAATDVALLEDACDANLADREFFIRKAVGWALRQHARVDPLWVTAYTTSRGARMSPLSRREALKHLV